VIDILMNGLLCLTQASSHIVVADVRLDQLIGKHACPSSDRDCSLSNKLPELHLCLSFGPQWRPSDFNNAAGRTAGYGYMWIN
jgi:hypothetical protein